MPVERVHLCLCTLDKKEAESIIHELTSAVYRHSSLQHLADGLYSFDEDRVTRTKESIIIRSKPEINISLSLSKTMSEAVHNVAADGLGLAYDGQDLYASARCWLALPGTMATQAPLAQCKNMHVCAFWPLFPCVQKVSKELSKELCCAEDSEDGAWEAALEDRVYKLVDEGRLPTYLLFSVGWQAKKIASLHCSISDLHALCHLEEEFYTVLGKEKEWQIPQHLTFTKTVGEECP